MKYEFDLRKAKDSLADHGIWFDAAERFDWDSAIEYLDDREDYGEDRFAAHGFIDLNLCVLVYTVRGDAIPIISLRKATRQKRQNYARQER